MHFSDDKGLTCHTFDEESDSYPFKGWSDARILCYRIEVDEEERITMMTPYVDTNIIEQIERLELTKASSEVVDELENQLSVSDETSIELFELQMKQEAINNATDEALIEIYEMMEGE